MTTGAVPRWALETWRAGAAAADEVHGERARWGFDHETWLLAGSGHRLVVQRRSDRSDPTRVRSRGVRAAVRAAGLIVPEPSLAGRDAGHAVVGLPFVEGQPGSELLAGEAGAELIGRLCGGVAARLATIHPVGLGLPGRWASGARIGPAGERWLRRCAGLLDARTTARIAHVLDIAVREVDAVPGRLAHGDLAPVNLLVRDGAAAAVLDLDRARLAHPLFDAAWFDWVVTHHHPEVADAAWRGFASAAGLPGNRPAEFAWLQPLELLERAAGAPRVAVRARWIERLGTSLAGGGPR